MSDVLSLLLEGADPHPGHLAEILGKDKAEVEAELRRLEEEKTLLGWLPVLNPEKVEDGRVRAVIEVKISPEREGGFDRLALRIARFDEVESCYLMSGGYDLLVFVSGKNLRAVAAFGTAFQRDCRYQLSAPALVSPYPGCAGRRRGADL